MTEGRPTWTSGMPSFAVASAIRRSHAAAISRPAPRQYPDIRATTGTGVRRIASHTSWIEVMNGRAASGVTSTMNPMSAPPMRARSPLPRSTTALRSGLAPTRSMAAARASASSFATTLSFASLS